MKKLIIFLGLIIFGFQAYAQRGMMNESFRIGGDRTAREALGLCCTTQASLGNNPTVMNAFSDFKDSFGDPTFTKQSGYARIKGTAYYDKEFVEATIFANGDEAARFYVRYDAFNDDIEIKRNKHNINTESLVRDENISCKIDGETLVYKTFTDTKKNVATGYLSPIYKGGRYVIYVRKMKIYKEGKAAKTSHGTTFPPRFLDKTEYYVTAGKHNPQHVNLRKKEVLAFFDSEEKKKIESFIKDKGLKFETPYDLAKVFEHAEQISTTRVASRQ